MPQYENINGVWKETKKIYDNIGGVWKEVKNSYDNIGGVWKESYKSSILSGNVPIGQVVYVPRNDGTFMKAIVAFKNYTGYPSNSVSLIGLPDEIISVHNGSTPSNYLTGSDSRSFHPKIINNFELLKSTLKSACITTTVSATWESQNKTISVTDKAFALNGEEIANLTNAIRYEIDIPGTERDVLLRDQRSIRVREDDGWNTYSGFDTFRCISSTSYEIYDVEGITTTQYSKTRYIFNIPNTLQFIEQDGNLILNI